MLPLIFGETPFVASFFASMLLIELEDAMNSIFKNRFFTSSCDPFFPGEWFFREPEMNEPG